MYEYIIEQAKTYCPRVERGEFGADMKVSLTNDGPFTIVLNSKDL
jgi:D-tyrosyl-tRNA(Tyr) deacylase